MVMPEHNTPIVRAASIDGASDTPGWSMDVAENQDRLVEKQEPEVAACACLVANKSVSDAAGLFAGERTGVVMPVLSNIAGVEAPTDVAAGLCTLPPLLTEQGKPAEQVVLCTSRKRLRQKQEVVEYDMPLFGRERSCAPVEAGKSWAGFDETTFWAAGHRERYLKWFSKFRWWSSHRKKKDVDSPDELFLARIRWPGEFTKLLPAEKARVMQLFMEESKCPPTLRRWGARVWPASIQTDMVLLRKKRVHLMWQGEWGLLREWSPLPTMPVEELVRRLRLEEQYQQLWEEFQQFAGALSARLKAGVWAASLEVCTESWAEGCGARVHAHAYVERLTGHLDVSISPGFVFRASAPQMCISLGAQANTVFLAGLCRLPCSKTGVLWAAGDWKAYADFPVQVRWVLQTTAAGKTPPTAPRADALRVAASLTYRQPDSEQHLEDRQAAETVGSCSKDGVLPTTLPPISPSAEVDRWLSLYGRGHWHQKKFLVLDGPNGMGQTQFVKNLFGFEKTLELKCDAMEHLVLHGFDARHHTCILLDDVSPKFVLKERKVFQCPDHWVQVRWGPTGHKKQQVRLHETCIVIASNNWCERVALLGEADQAWLAGNAVCVRVEAPLWLPRP